MVRQSDEGQKIRELQLIDISRKTHHQLEVGHERQERQVYACTDITEREKRQRDKQQRDKQQNSQSAGKSSRQQVARRRQHIRKKRHRVKIRTAVVFLILLFLGVKVIVPFIADAGNISAAWSFFSSDKNLVQGLPAEVFAKHPEWEEDFLTPNEYSRPQNELKEVKNIFVHYTANPGSSAAQNRSYFEQQKDTHERSVSAHFIIGYEGEIVQCVPLNEIAYAVKSRNYDSVSIECCHLEQDGSFTQETYDSLIKLLAWLAEAYDLESEDILRHYDCGGKKCPLYYTEHEDEWEQLKKDVDKL